MSSRHNQISAISIIVHPTFHQLHTSPNPSIGQRTVTANELRTYLQIIRAAKKDTATLVMIIRAKPEPLTSGAFSAQVKTQEKFISFAQKELGSRAIIFSSNIGAVSSHPQQDEEHQSIIQEQLSRFNLSKEMSVNITGQYKDSCVDAVRSKMEWVGLKIGIKMKTKITKNTKRFDQWAQGYARASQVNKLRLARRKSNTKRATKTKKIHLR